MQFHVIDNNIVHSVSALYNIAWKVFSQKNDMSY